MLSCAGCTLMLFVTCGLAFNVFSAAQPYVLAQNGFTNTQTSLITTIRSAAYLLGTFAIGRYYRRLGYRTGCALAAMLACVSFLLFAAAKSLAAYYFAGAVAGVSYALGSMVPASILMRRWFRAFRAGHRDLLCRNRTGDRRVFPAVHRHCGGRRRRPRVFVDSRVLRGSGCARLFPHSQRPRRARP